MPKTSILLILGFTAGLFAQREPLWPKTIIDDNNIGRNVNVDVADITGDTKLDLLVTNYDGNEIILYENNYPFWDKHIIANVGATFAYFGDMDGDDTLDVVATLYRSMKMVWYENNHPTWTQHTIDNATDFADYMIVEDIDGDDTLDVLTAGGLGGGDVVWYENNYPDWTEHIIDAGASGVAVLSFSDIDGDGLRDIIATMVNDHDVVWYKNEDNGFTWTKYTIDNNLNNAWGLSIGDIDGDDTLDVVATRGGPYRSGTDVVWYENNLPTWTKHEIDTDLDGANIVDVADIDNDGTLDIIADGFAADDVVWYENNHPTWTKHSIDEKLDGPRVFLISDVDGDNVNDLIVPATSSVVWYKNPYTTVAFGQSLEVSPIYIPPQQGDTLQVRAHISNPENHQVNVHALIQGNNFTFNDTIQLFDDGLQGDSIAADNIFAARKSLPLVDEDYFDVSLLTTDLDESFTTYCTTEKHFTTVGPVVFDGITAILDSIIEPGDLINCQFALKNLGSTGIAESITAELSSNDSCFTSLAISGTFGNIEPRESNIIVGGAAIRVSEDCPGNMDLTIKVDIYSDGHHFWTDSFMVYIHESLGIETDTGIMPAEFALYQNYPNPFNPITTIKYELPQRSDVQITIYDLLGRKVTTLVNQTQNAGFKSVQWDASNVANGMYFYQIQAGDFVQTKKMVLLK